MGGQPVHASNQLLELGFNFESLVEEKGMCKVKQLSKVEVCSWLAVRTLVEEVRVKCRAVFGMNSLPKQLVAFSLGHAMEEYKAVSQRLEALEVSSEVSFIFHKEQ